MAFLIIVSENGLNNIKKIYNLFIKIIYKLNFLKIKSYSSLQFYSIIPNNNLSFFTLSSFVNSDDDNNSFAPCSFL